jgi:predicted patatin/cPLA2 family phospholipase
VNYRSGGKVFVSPKDEGMTRDRFIDAMLASLSVPVFIEPTIIDGEACLDGGVRDMVPFEPAIMRGAQSVVPIFLHPESIETSKDPFKRIDKILQRTLMIMMDETLHNDYEMTKLINLGTQLRLEILAVVENKSSVKKKIQQIFRKPEYAYLVGSDKQLMSIVEGIRPDYTLTDEPLKLDPVLMREWMKLGYKKADEVVTVSPFEE